MMSRRLLPIMLLLTAAAQGASAQDGVSAYKYSGSHAGGPADELIANGTPVPVIHHPVDPAYRYSGTHAGGPADTLISNGTPAPAGAHRSDPAYRYSGTHAGGPANDLIPD